MRFPYYGHCWIGTRHCLREQFDPNEYQCVNDHTGCIYNNGHNECMFDKKSNKKYDSPLKQNESKRTDSN